MSQSVTCPSLSVECTQCSTVNSLVDQESSVEQLLAVLTGDGEVEQLV